MHLGFSVKKLNLSAVAPLSSIAEHTSSRNRSSANPANALRNQDTLHCPRGRYQMHDSTNRREFLGDLGSTALTLAVAPLAAAAPKKRPKVAAVFTELTYRSHAHVILENFLEPYLFNGKLTDP